ncbi:TIGR03084 family metal-binding protein [Streptomyces sp. V4-01]|uniref:TIGR03084 family metal-binding protein n=1 Tax=Actinacidiphila polyblastidii TaxID=3110430 RepID=A0ABU7PFN4_9ACTN|nr:TIGR03084 family metal-binding protein [Streptomyces sp. V4-01]
MTAMQDVHSDLATEAAELDTLLADLNHEQWTTQTPAPGWTVAHQIAHLAFIAGMARLAATDAETFEAVATEGRKDFQGAVDAKLAEYLADTIPAVYKRWQDEQRAADEALAALPKDGVVPWLVNPLPVGVLAAAGLMELYAHGQDIRDALGVSRTPSDRIGHLAFFGTRTRDFGYLARSIEPPKEEFRFELTAPSGIVWAFGPEDAEQRISGPAEDYCLLITRRRHRDDLALTATGSEAERYLDIAQAYRGPAGEGRKPGQFATS